ncbi:MAG: hypothetical protein ACI88A_004545 [Paraglaciecola sp.]|jgi:hypothetical protein
MRLLNIVLRGFCTSLNATDLPIKYARILKNCKQSLVVAITDTPVAANQETSNV